MTLEDHLRPLLRQTWSSLELGGVPPRRVSSMMLKGNRKSVFLLFGTRSSRPAFVLKLSTMSEDHPRLENEHSLLCSLSERMPDRAVSLLTPVRLVELPVGLGLIRRAAPGKPLTFRVRPLHRDGPRQGRLFELAYSWLLRLQKDVIEAYPEFQEPRAREDVIRSHPVLNRTSGSRIPEVVEALQAVKLGLQDKSIPVTVEHGDYNPDNILCKGRRLGTIDWEWGRLPGLPLVDLFEFALQYTRLSSFLGLRRAQSLSPDHLISAFDPDGPLAPTLRDWVARACQCLQLERGQARRIFTLFAARHMIDDPGCSEALSKTLCFFNT